MPEPATATGVFGPMRIPFGNQRWLVDTIIRDHKLAELAREMVEDIRQMQRLIPVEWPAGKTADWLSRYQAVEGEG